MSPKIVCFSCWKPVNHSILLTGSDPKVHTQDAHISKSHWRKVEKPVSAVSILHSTRPVHSAPQKQWKTTAVQGSSCPCSAEKETDHPSADTTTKQSRKLQQFKAAPCCQQAEKETTPLKTPLQNRAENYSSARQPLSLFSRKRARSHQWRHCYRTEQKTTTVQGSPLIVLYKLLVIIHAGLVHAADWVKRASLKATFSWLSNKDF